MTTFEYTYLACRPFLPVLHGAVRRQLLKIAGAYPDPAILDVGGRKSPYTIGIPGRITVSDLEREFEIQKQLTLGIDDEVRQHFTTRRSNVQAVRLDDMTRSSFAGDSFDVVVAVEVLEHVEEDGRFLDEVWRVLKPGGHLLLTTPNGDSVPNTNPDHKRHYSRAALLRLLEARFACAEVRYAIRGGVLYDRAIRSWSAKHPVRTATTMMAALGNHLQSASRAVREQAEGTQELFAYARK